MKMYLNETRSTVRVGKQFCDMFSITKRLRLGIVWLSLLLDYIRSVRVNKNGLNLWGTHQLMVNTDDVNIMDDSVHITEKNPEFLLVTSREIFLNVTADKTKYMSISLDQNAGRIQYLKLDDISFDRVDEYRYVETT